MVFGPMLFFLAPADAPSGKHKIGYLTMFMRGLLAAISISIGVFLTEVDETAAGIATTFPAIFTTTMISLWISQDSAVSVGAVGPLLMGSVSVSMYSCLFFTFTKLMKPLLPEIPLIIVSCLLAYMGALIGGSLPSFFLIRCRRARNRNNTLVEDETTTMMHSTKPNKV